MQSYSFAPPVGPPTEGRKNYVFVDEHNRHKRLKVMRACSGCRKRKIKCDAATTNTWPCSACKRVKLVCQPPTSGQDDSMSSTGQQSEPIQAGFLGSSGPPNTSHQGFSMPQAAVGNGIPYSGGLGLFQSCPQPPPSQPQIYTEVRPPHIPPAPTTYQPQIFPTTEGPTLETTDADLFDNPNEQSTADDLGEVLGELKIDETGIAPYIRQQNKGGVEPVAPVQEELEERLPPLKTKAGSAVRIPPELMPSDDEALDCFKIYFKDIHPYVPVIHRSQFYWQWEHDRTSISPLLLESLFACAGRFSDNPAQGAQWLALANRHEPNFMDVPRLSTIQALILLLKARESTPKKGYYYRSWQTVKTLVSMSKDLDIHEHYGAHEGRQSCGLSPVECLVRTRVWQTLMVLEVMVGGPQGRSDFGVDPETVDMRPTLDIGGLDQFEINQSKQYAYFVGNAHNIRNFVGAFHKLKKKQTHWAADPKFFESNPFFADWLRSLPPELQINYPADNSPPWIPSHFVANMHSHFHLGIILLHRPQLVASKSFAAGGDWRIHLSLCYSSAKKLCRLQEAVLGYYGLSGLLFMQRGINFTIYCILVCTMLHLVAITSPDPNFHCDAREFFTRHMRILEQCSSAWPMPEIQVQIDSLRLAFSADISRPFELKPTFPYGSPSEPYQPSPPPFDSPYNAPQINQIPGAYSSRVGYSTNAITPPISATTEDSKADLSQLQAFGMMQPNPINQHQFNAPLVDENSWDPTRIFHHWDNAFAVASSFNTDSPPPMGFPTIPPGFSTPPANQYPVYSPYSTKVPTVPSTQSDPQPSFNEGPPLFTARDWQRNVASVYDPHGLKRRWNYSMNRDSGSYSKRQR